MKLIIGLVGLALTVATAPSQAMTVNIDLSGSTTGTLVTGVGASFAQTFVGQTVVAGNGISGTPSNPLTLAPVGTIDVAFFDPGVSAASNSLLSQPGNAAPLSILFDTLAVSFDFTMGSSNAGSTINVRAFNSLGALTGSTTVFMGNGYNIYSLTGLGTFQGLTFFDNNDPAGVRFQNLSYNSVIPEPAAWAMLLTGFGAIGATMRRRSAGQRKIAA